MQFSQKRCKKCEYNEITEQPLFSNQPIFSRRTHTSCVFRRQVCLLIPPGRRPAVGGARDIPRRAVPPAVYGRPTLHRPGRQGAVLRGAPRDTREERCTPQSIIILCVPLFVPECRFFYPTLLLLLFLEKYAATYPPEVLLSSFPLSAAEPEMSHKRRQRSQFPGCSLSGFKSIKLVVLTEDLRAVMVEDKVIPLVVQLFMLQLGPGLDGA